MDDQGRQHRLEELKREGRRMSEKWRERIGTAVRRARERAGMTQSALAAFVGVDVATISKTELGKTIPDFATLESIADRLGVTIDVLVGREPAVSPLVMPREGADETAPPFRNPWPAIAEIQRQIDQLAQQLQPLVEERREPPTKQTPKRKRSA